MSDEIRAEGVGPALGGEGSPCHSFAFAGRTWKVGWPTQKAKEWHELLVARLAEDELEARRPIYAPKKFAQKQEDLEAKLCAGEYRVGGALWEAAVAGPDSMALLVCSLLQEHHPGTTVADARAVLKGAPREAMVALAMVIPPFVQLLVGQAPTTRESREEAALVAAKLAEYLTGLAARQTGEAPPAAPTG